MQIIAKENNNADSFYLSVKQLIYSEMNRVLSIIKSQIRFSNIFSRHRIDLKDKTKDAQKRLFQ